ncbi:alpha/beta fold hydrolase [Paraburkholderia sediminicola]|uniref:alpha/beta fold hydrolase n=1 Tax=Paraburkholderia sediminicola TaxID=458836 RepID=UPI0038BCEA63
MFVVTNGIRLHVEEQGNGSPTLVFLHYWGGSSRTWNDVIAALPASYHAIAPDQRGWGDSEAPANGYNLKDFADDLAGLIAALDLQSYVLIGHSMGGKIAQLFASRRPRGLAGLVLVAPAPPVPLHLPDEAFAAMRGAYLSRESVEMSIDLMLSSKPLSAAHREQIIADSLRGAPQARDAWPEYTSREDITKEVARITVPTIVIAGELDRVDSLDVHQTELLPRIPHAKLHVLPSTGHLSPLESPQEVAKTIHEFVSELDTNPNQPKALEQFPVAFDTAFNAGDIDGVLECLTPNATMRMTDGSEITGRENMREHFKELLNGALQLRNEVRRVLQSGDIALLLLDWTLNITLPNGDKNVEQGTATQVMQRGTDGVWRLRVSNPLGLN